MPNHLSPETVVQCQLDAYNAKDLDAWLATYAQDAKQFALGGELLAHGHAAIRARTAPRFTEPNLFAKLLSRTVIGNVVIDHEEVTRTFPEGKGHVELVCIYQVANGQIQSATFSMGPPVLAGPAA
ncbi:MAG: nuclear transport factor 2 family protein [Burkholderiales bacterium]